jgi:hypothetical protein
MNEVRVLTKPYNRLPYELQRYTYSFIYPDVRLACGFPSDESIYNLVSELVETYTGFTTGTIEIVSNIFYKYFPSETVYQQSENELIVKYLYRVFDKDDSGRHIHWYEETGDTDYNGFIQELYEKIIYEKNKTGDTKLLYKMMASYQYHLTHSDEYYDMVMNESEY